MELASAYVLLFALAAVVALIARRIGLPYTVALVIAGLALGPARVLEPPRLTRDLLYAVFLPGLVFEAAFQLELERFLENKLAICGLAIPGVVASMALTAALLVPAVGALGYGGFELRHGLVFGALIAATDPIAVTALFRTLGAPKRLAAIVEGESLLNDGTAIVLLTVVLDVLAGRTPTAGAATLDFLKITGLGALTGAVIALAVSRAIEHADDPMLEVTLTAIAAWGSFVAAERFGFSGVISTMAAGLICGSHAPRGPGGETRVAVRTFWEAIAFAMNSIVFLLIGFEVRLSALAASWLPIVAAFVAVLVARAAMVYAASAALRTTRERVPSAWSAVITWAGLRGALCMVLVLALPQDFPFRDLLVTMTFGVVLLTIVLGGLTMAALCRRLGLAGDVSSSSGRSDPSAGA